MELKEVEKILASIAAKDPDLKVMRYRGMRYLQSKSTGSTVISPQFYISGSEWKQSKSDAS